jgi:hypothetical protein
MRVIWKVSGLTLLLRVVTLWRGGDGLFFKVPPLASNALLTTLYPLLENMLQTVYHFKISCLRAPFLWLEKPRNCMGRDLNWILCSAWKEWIDGTPLEYLPYSPDLAWSMRFQVISTQQKRALRKEISTWSMVCSTFARSGWSIVRNALLTKGGTLKNRSSPCFYTVLTQSNKVSPQTLQTALVHFSRMILLPIVLFSFLTIYCNYPKISK